MPELDRPSEDRRYSTRFNANRLEGTGNEYVGTSENTEPKSPYPELPAFAITRQAKEANETSRNHDWSSEEALDRIKDLTRKFAELEKECKDRREKESQWHAASGVRLYQIQEELRALLTHTPPNQVAELLIWYELGKGND